MVAGSFWGCHRTDSRREKGFSESWNSTSGKVELTALAHDYSLLILDETKLAGKGFVAQAENVIAVLFAISEQTEKQREGPQREGAGRRGERFAHESGLRRSSDVVCSSC